VLKAKWDPGQPAYVTALLMLAGIVVWHSFAESLSRATNTLVENSNLIQKVVFPSEVLPAYLTISSLINMGIGLAVVVLGVAWFAYTGEGATAVDPRFAIGLGRGLLFLPILIAVQAVFMLGMGYVFATLNMFARDTFHLIGVLLTVWMFMTPIFYPARLVGDAGLGWVLRINPMYWLIDTYRRVIVYGWFPGWSRVVAFALVALLVLYLGSTFFLAQKRRFPDLV
jgi:lipopolysaccharide transport system permease protein